MAVTKEYRTRIQTLLGEIRPIQSKAMFGGVGLYADGLIFAILDNDRIWFKFDGATKSDFEKAGCEQWRPMPSAPPMGYFELPSGVIDRSDELEVWIDKAVGAAARKQAAKPSKKRK